MRNLKRYFHLIFSLIGILSSSTPLQAQTTLDAKAGGVEKTVVTDSMIGYRDTLIFYVFGESHAVLAVGIGNKDLDFPVSATLHKFAAGTDAEGMGKWVNNQHSDGLFGDAPEPESSEGIPEASCATTKHELVKQVDSLQGKFAGYSVTFRITNVPVLGDIKLKEFTDTATVYVASKDG